MFSAAVDYGMRLSLLLEQQISDMKMGKKSEDPNRREAESSSVLIPIFGIFQRDTGADYFMYNCLPLRREKNEQVYQMADRARHGLITCVANLLK